MSGTHGALRLIELASARMCHAISGTLGSLDEALSAQLAGRTGGTAVLDAAKALTNQLKLQQAAWVSAERPVSLAEVIALAPGLPEGIAIDVSAMPQTTVFPPITGRFVLTACRPAAASSWPAPPRICSSGSTALLLPGQSAWLCAWSTRRKRDPP
jgi:hypothetical protein